ncbi:MAG: aconitate hydratase [Desulfobacteraceae bacterium]|nr:MAG: aconitate hydratase [Desulfobacteraceae bacterium]
MSYEKHLTSQILSEHLVEGSLVPGEEIRIRIDQTLTQDATGTLAYLEFMSLGIERVKARLSVSYVDHNTVQTSFENADDHLFLQDAAARYGLYFSRPGNGISHQVHLERFGVPGETLLGSDSHTPTAGGMGMLAMGAGGLDVALAMAGEPFTMKVPDLTGIILKGAFPPWVGAKDVILSLLQRLTVKGGLGRILEYSGAGLAGLTVPERSTITNMGAELGAWTSIFPSDEVTRRFMKAQGRVEAWRPISNAEGVDYREALEIDLSRLEPMVACPHSPDAVVRVEDLDKIHVDQVAIGSCTNSSYRDLRLAADLLAGKKVHPDVSLVIAPGSRQVMAMLARDGSLARLIEAGARILEVACGPCIGMNQAPPSGGVSVRTFNRNFEGRSGTKDAKVYLSGPQVAAAAAITGRIAHPRILGMEPSVGEPKEFLIDDSMIIAPPKDPSPSRLRMGPNIKPLPELEPLPESLSLAAILKTGDNITTDDILPGGAKILPLRSNISAISRFVFAGKDPEFSVKAKTAAPFAVVGGENYGQGSSREHAALAPRFLGLRAVLARSFARLHRANLINFGVLPLIISFNDYGKIDQGDTLEIKYLREGLEKNSEISVMIPAKSLALKAGMDLTSRERRIILAGGLLNLVREGLTKPGMHARKQ